MNIKGTMDFSDALICIKEGDKVAREGWNGKGMFLFFTDGREEFNQIYLPYISMRNAQGHIVPWLASQSDVLADDWSIVSIEDSEDSEED
jgi:hypothetical protein